MIILLDGSKGAGKSTTAEILVSQVRNSIHLSIDEIRRTFFPDDKRDIRERNKDAFEIIIAKTNEAISDGSNVIIDCGVSEDRAKRFENMSKENNTPLYKFFLRAAYDTQLHRVRERDKSKGKESTDVVRFDEIYHYFNKKNLDGYIVIETDKLSPREAADLILKTTRSEQEAL